MTHKRKGRIVRHVNKDNRSELRAFEIEENEELVKKGWCNMGSKTE